MQAKVGLDLQGRPEPKHSSLSSFDELDICLPDGDSLITIDYYIFPQDSMFVAAGLSSGAPVNTFERLSDSGVATYFKSLHMQQSFPQLHQSQLKPAKARMSISKSQESKKGSRIKPRDLKSYLYDLQSLQYFPTSVHITPSQHSRAAATGFDHSGNYQLLQDLPVPDYFPPQQLYGLPRVVLPQHTSDEMAFYQNEMLISSLNFKQQCHEDLENASSRNFEMGIESKAVASSNYS
ncbi:hypothetical protein CRYUN_Cryun12cG0088900 [Craigia yunnanensis]